MGDLSSDLPRRYSLYSAAAPVMPAAAGALPASESEPSRPTR